MPLITLTCDKCDKPFEIEDDAAGEKVSCPYCGNVHRIPTAGRPLASEPATIQDSPPTTPAAPAQASPRQPAAARAVSNDPEVVAAIVRQGMFRAHPFLYLLMVLIFAAGLAMAVLSKSAPQTGATPDVLLWGGVFLMAAGVLWWLGWWAAPHRWVKMTITNKRVILQQGIVMHTTNEVIHRQITDIVVRQRLLERLLNVGYIGIDSAGQGGNPTNEGDEPAKQHDIEIEMHHIPNPMGVKETINKFRLH